MFCCFYLLFVCDFIITDPSKFVNTFFDNFIRFLISKSSEYFSFIIYSIFNNFPTFYTDHTSMRRPGQYTACAVRCPYSDKRHGTSSTRSTQNAAERRPARISTAAACRCVALAGYLALAEIYRICRNILHLQEYTAQKRDRIQKTLSPFCAVI